MADLKTDDGLKRQLDALRENKDLADAMRGWTERLSEFLQLVHARGSAGLHNVAYLRELWDRNPVSATGNGQVDVSPALDNEEFRQRFALALGAPLPEGAALGDDADRFEAVALELRRRYDAVRSEMKSLCSRSPTLKLNRVMCALYPQYFTSIANVGSLLRLHQVMGGGNKDHPVQAHIAIRRRIDRVLDPVAPNDFKAQAYRICLPWQLWEAIRTRASDKKDDTAAVLTGAPVDRLTPLAAAERRKGLTAIRGGLATLLEIVAAIEDGVTRAEFLDVIGQTMPGLAQSSKSTMLSVILQALDLCEREGDHYRLSPRGLALKDSQDPDELADLLLTKVLGVDHLLVRLNAGPAAPFELKALLHKVNPGWSSNYAVGSMLFWLTNLGLVDSSSSAGWELTERGRDWARRVWWTPEFLSPSATATQALDATVSLELGLLTLPTWPELWARLQRLAGDQLRFDERKAEQLHVGLWSHQVRHFAVLTGISGSGKTQLALKYAHALCGAADEAGPSRVRVIPVQSGWFDPGPLLGYVNPLQEASYRSAPFLDLLLRAAEDPTNPYVAILDEMNLSHPEQYLAPVLSAMETSGDIDLHALEDDTIDVPRQVPYPANLAIVGTVNMDETTLGLSDKVLDRAHTLEFWDVDVDSHPGWDALGEALAGPTRQVLNALQQALLPVRMHFGLRVVGDIQDYLRFDRVRPVELTRALDEAVYAKVLPKLRGDQSPRFEQALDQAAKALKDAGLATSGKKVDELLHDLRETGSARFWR